MILVMEFLILEYVSCMIIVKQNAKTDVRHHAQASLFHYIYHDILKVNNGQYRSTKHIIQKGKTKRVNV